MRENSLTRLYIHPHSRTQDPWNVSEKSKCLWPRICSTPPPRGEEKAQVEEAPAPQRLLHGRQVPRLSSTSSWRPWTSWLEIPQCGRHRTWSHQKLPAGTKVLSLTWLKFLLFIIRSSWWLATIPSQCRQSRSRSENGSSWTSSSWSFCRWGSLPPWWSTTKTRPCPASPSRPPPPSLVMCTQWDRLHED